MMNRIKNGLAKALGIVFAILVVFLLHLRMLFLLTTAEMTLRRYRKRQFYMKKQAIQLSMRKTRICSFRLRA